MSTRNSMKGLKSATKAGYTKEWLEAHHEHPSPFPEELFTGDGPFTKDKLIELIKKTKAENREYVENNNRLLLEDFGYGLAIHGNFPPHIPIHYTRVVLPHSIHEEDAPIVFFVKDLKRNHNFNYDETILFYEELLDNMNIPYNITIMPLSQLHEEYPCYEDRRALSFLYEKFLVAKDVATPVNAFLGRKIISDGRIALPIDLTAEELIPEIETAMKTVFFGYKIFENGRTQSIKVGRHFMDDDLIAENIIDVLKQLVDIQPGGTKNIGKIVFKPCKPLLTAETLYLDTGKPTMPEKPTTTTTEETTDETPTESEKPNEADSLIVRCQTDFHAIISDTYICGDFDDSPDETKYPHVELLEGTNGSKAAAKDNDNRSNSGSNVHLNLTDQVMECLKKLQQQGKLANLKGLPGVTDNNPIHSRKALHSSGNRTNGRRL